MRHYSPRPNSTAFRALEVLKSFGQGAELTSVELAQLASIRPQDVGAILSAALRAEWVCCRPSDPTNIRKVFMWSLGPKAFAPKPPPEPRRRDRSQTTKNALFNSRADADVSARQKKLAMMRHPAARREEVEAVIPEGLQVKRGPSWTHDPRFQCAPGVQPFGAGFAAVKPGFDITTGRPWA